MYNTLVSAKTIIARIENNFDIDYAGWISRAPLWIADALDKIGIVDYWEPKKINLIVEDYNIEIPEDAVEDIRRILFITYEDYEVVRLNTINPIRQPKIITKGVSKETYSINNGYINTSFEEGIITLYYETVANEYDEERMIFLPKVPNNSIIQGAIEWYLFYCMLRKGHKHPTFSLDSNNPITNPYLMWKEERKNAIAETATLDHNDRKEISDMLTTFIADLNNKGKKYFIENDNSVTNDLDNPYSIENSE